VLDFIHTEADTEDLVHIYDAAGKRTSTPGRSGPPTSGREVTLVNASPAYLKGLTGKVVRVYGAPDIQLSEVSTTLPGRQRSSRSHPAGRQGAHPHRLHLDL
jgi:hypothetical protein